jgi:tetratricopeptide (TPR) repeat protein
MAVDDLRHPDADELAAYAEGALDARARGEVERHLAECAACRAVVMETVAFLAANPAEQLAPPAVIPFRARRSVTGVAAALAVAAALVAAVFLARPEWLRGPRSDRPELQELIAAVANEPTRPVEGRLSGGFKYAPAPSASRGAADRNPSPEVRIAAAKIEQLAREDANGEHDGVLGTALITVGRSEDAIAALTRATAKEPSNAALLADLSSAQLNRCPRDPAACGAALDSTDKALRLDSAFVPALFNRAVALEMMGRRDDAAAAWRRYLQIDGASEWGAEAQAHLAGLQSR